MTPEASSPASGEDPNIILFPGGKPLRVGVFEKPLHLAIGMFDGVHLGHQAVIEQAITAAQQENGDASGVLTFDPHPSHVLYPERATPMLMPIGQRIERMLRMGVEYVFVQDFTLAYAAREAEGFVGSLTTVFPGLQSLHVGENFRFGAKRSGNIATLKESGSALGVAVHAVDREVLEDNPISSSRIRSLLSSGDIGSVNAMLGYPYTIAGKIQPGKQVGRGLGFPTLNVPWARDAAPRFGVYRVALKRAGETERMLGVANYGLRPTVGDASEPLLEVHLIDPQSLPGTGDPVKVALLDFIRPERPFPSMEALRAQIEKDTQAVRKVSLDADSAILETF